MSTFAWDDLRYFLAFARAGSMQAAAKALGVNQSTVQRRIAELEERVGRRLVERHLGSYRLTALGEELRPAAEGVEAAVAAFERDLAARDKGLTGTIRLTCGSSLAACSGGRHSSMPFMHAILDCGSSWSSPTGFSIFQKGKPISRSASQSVMASLRMKPSSDARSRMCPGLSMPAAATWNGTVGRTMRRI